MSHVSSLVSEASRLTDVFGRWPSFHDAEVISMSLERQMDSTKAPVLTAKIHVFEMTREVSESGHFVCRKHTVVELQFTDIDDLELEGFNHQNALNGLSISDSAKPGRLAVEFEEAYGVGANFTCGSVAVLSAAPGIPPESVYGGGWV